jgi:hypothetical protein
MRPTLRVSLLICALAAFTAQSLSAQFVEQQAPWGFGPQDQIQFQSFSGLTGFGSPVGPYTGMVTSMPGQPLISIYNTDYMVGIKVGPAWTANVSELNLADMADTKLGILDGASNALARYKKAAWLSSMFTFNQSVTAWQEIQAAVWTVALNGNFSQMPYYGQYGNWLNLANQAEANNYAGFDFREWVVVTDVNAPGAPVSYDPEMVEAWHEGLVRVTVTPEPETVILFLSGLLILGLAWRRGSVA